MSSFHQELSFQSFEAAVNGVARIARTQGFRIHQRKSQQKTQNQADLQLLASFGCTAPSCGWFISFRRVLLDGPSTSTTPAEQWVVYTLYDNHRSTCKPARSRRRRPSISSISSLETERTEDELPPELLRPYERSPSVPVLMHPRGYKPDPPLDTRTVSTAFSQADVQEDGVDDHAREPLSEPPDPIALSNYIQDLLASLESQVVPSGTATASVDPQALLASLNNPLPMPSDILSSYASISANYSQPSESTEQQWHRPFSTAANDGHQDTARRFGSDLQTLPDQFQRAASISGTIDPQTINPASLLSPGKQNGHNFIAPSQSIFQNYAQQPVEPEISASDSFQQYTAPVSTDEWSNDGSEDAGEDHEQGNSFMQHDFVQQQEPAPYDYQDWTHNAINDASEHSDTEESSEAILPAAEEEEALSSSDSDIPAEKLLNINTSRSNRSTSTAQRSPPLPNPHVDNTYPTEFLDDVQDMPLQDSPPPPVPLKHTQPQRLMQFPADEPEEHFDIYNIFYSFEEAETAIMANAKKTEAPLKIRYRPNLLGGGMNARKQACLECLRLCGYRIYLKDDYRGQWRVTNMEGDHKPSCLQGKAKSAVRRGTNPFRVNRAKEKDFMEVSVPVWQSSTGKRKRREESFSSDRSSSPSILVVTHSDAVMKSVRTVGRGFTPPLDYWHPSLLSPPPEPVKKSKSKGKGRGRPRKTGGESPERAIELLDSDGEDGDTYHPPADDLPNRHGSRSSRASNSYIHPDVRVEEHDPPAANGFARKKLPTAAQLVHGSNLPGIQPRHKIPTKPFGRSPRKTKQRIEQRRHELINGTATNTKFNSLAGTLPGDSSANDDDDGEEDMYYQTSRFSQRTLNKVSSSRALRSARRSNVTQSRTQSATNGHVTRQASSHDADFAPHATQPSRPAKKAKSSTIPPPPPPPHTKVQYKRGINANITSKMSVSQVGFSKRENAFLARGGYNAVKDLTREGLACTVEDFAVFRSLLGDLNLEVGSRHDVLATKQIIRNTVKSLAEEVRVRSAIVWEAAGMMEEGSDAYAEESHAPGQNGTATEADDFFASEDDARQGHPNGKSSKARIPLYEHASPRRSLHPKENGVSNGHAAAHQHHNYDEGLSSASSDIEFLGARS